MFITYEESVSTARGWRLIVRPTTVTRFAYGNCGPLQFAGLSITRTGWFALSVSINVAAVGDPGDEDQIFGIVHRIDDAVIANADAEVIPAGKLY